jgi:hypothetical protein
MASPVELSDLDFAPLSSLSADNLMLIRIGLTDYNTTLGNIQNINIPALPNLSDPGGPQSGDLILLSRGALGSSQNYGVNFDYVGLPSGTTLWFYSGSPPNGNWVIVPGTGDKLIAVTDPSAGGLKYAGSNGGTQNGNWQQGDVNGIPNTGLTINQIPAHQHSISNVAISKVQRGTADTPVWRSVTGSQFTDFTGSASGTPSGGQPTSLAHNHGAVWRPFANIGIICKKSL